MNNKNHQFVEQQQQLQNCRELAQEWFALANQESNPYKQIYLNFAERLALIVGHSVPGGIPEVIIEAERHRKA